MNSIQTKWIKDGLWSFCELWCGAAREGPQSFIIEESHSPETGHVCCLKTHFTEEKRQRSFFMNSFVLYSVKCINTPVCYLMCFFFGCIKCLFISETSVSSLLKSVTRVITPLLIGQWGFGVADWLSGEIRCSVSTDSEMWTSACFVCLTWESFSEATDPWLDTRHFIWITIRNVSFKRY